MIDHPAVDVLTQEVNQLLVDFPDIVPSFKPADFLSHSHGKTRYYNLAGVRAYLESIIGKLGIEIEQEPDSPITEVREFSFISDTELRRVLERDYVEIQRAFISDCWKSVIILSGGAIETILLDVLKKDEAHARSAKSAPGISDLTKWDLSHLIDVAVEMKKVTSGVEKLSHSVRDYRNLVHPGKEIRDKLTFGKEEAKIALEVLHIVHRDLSS